MTMVCCALGLNWDPLNQTKTMSAEKVTEAYKPSETSGQHVSLHSLITGSTDIKKLWVLRTNGSTMTQR